MRVSIKEKIKPLWILFSSKWGGPEQVLMADMASLSESGISCSLLCLEGSAVHAFAIRHKNIQVFTLPTAPSRIFDFSFYRFLKELLAKLAPNIILINNHYLLFFLEPLLFRNKRISVISVRHSSQDKSLLLIFKKLFYRRLEYMIVLSDSVKKSILLQGILPEKKIKVINLGLDFTRFDPQTANGVSLRQEWGADSETIVVGCVGRMVPELGQDTFIKAAAGLTKHHSWKMKFILIDEDPLVSSAEYVDELKQLVTQFHLERQVLLPSLGEESLPRIMAAFDIFVMPGSEEVSGLGALEALAMEKPVVLSHVDGARDIVGKDQFGLLVRPQDAFDLQAKILNLVVNSNKRRQMGHQGREHVLKHFDKKTRLVRSIDIYERCLKRQIAKAGLKKN